jgi:ribose-phosphate pyrophosphokinase
MAAGFAILCGNANRALAAKIADAAGVALSDALVERFPDGEASVEIRASVRDKACRRASAARIFAVIPYFGYARSDKRHGRREPISARLVADLLQTAGTGHVITIDLHASQSRASSAFRWTA